MKEIAKVVIGMEHVFDNYHPVVRSDPENSDTQSNRRNERLKEVDMHAIMDVIDHTDSLNQLYLIACFNPASAGVAMYDGFDDGKLYKYNLTANSSS